MTRVGPHTVLDSDTHTVLLYSMRYLGTMSIERQVGVANRLRNMATWQAKYSRRDTSRKLKRISGNALKRWMELDFGTKSCTLSETHTLKTNRQLKLNLAEPWKERC